MYFQDWQIIQFYIMESFIRPLCFNGHNVQRFCMSESCQLNVATCDQADCQQSNYHQRCPTIPSSVILNMVRERQEKFNQVQREFVEFFEKMAKQTEIMKQDFMKALDAPEIRLHILERNLMDAIREDNLYTVAPRLICRVTKSLESEPESLKKITKIKNSITKTNNDFFATMKKSLKVIQGLGKQPSKKKDKTKTEKIEKQTRNQIVIKQAQKQAQMQTETEHLKKLLTIGDAKRYFLKNDTEVIKNQSNLVYEDHLKGDQGFVYFSPKQNKLFLKIIKDSGNIAVGVSCKIRRPQKVSKKPQKKQVMYEMIGIGNFRDRELDLQSLQYNSFEFSSGDVIKIQYIPSAFALLFQNLSNKLFVLLEDVDRKLNNSLEFYVYLQDEEDEVQILKSPQ